MLERTTKNKSLLCADISEGEGRNFSPFNFEVKGVFKRDFFISQSLDAAYLPLETSKMCLNKSITIHGVYMIYGITLIHAVC